MRRVASRIAVGAAALVLGACGTDGGTTPSAGGSGPSSTTEASPRPDPGATGRSLASDARILFLHHSTGGVIWQGGVPGWFTDHNAEHGTGYDLTEQAFPKQKPYGWKNYPYDYWNIWVDHAGPEPYQEEPTLEILSAEYDVIVWKHCYPVSNIAPDTGKPDVASSDKRLEHYRLQYLALREKMREFPDTRFVVWTAAALVAGGTTPEKAQRAEAFVDWTRDTWDEPGDNIFLWDFWQLETEGGRYLAAGNARSSGDSHPDQAFATRVAPLLGQRVVDVIEGRGDLRPS